MLVVRATNDELRRLAFCSKAINKLTLFYNSSDKRELRGARFELMKSKTANAVMMKNCRPIAIKEELASVRESRRLIELSSR